MSAPDVELLVAGDGGAATFGVADASFDRTAPSIEMRIGGLGAITSHVNTFAEWNNGLDVGPTQANGCASAPAGLVSHEVLGYGLRLPAVPGRALLSLCYGPDRSTWRRGL